MCNTKNYLYRLAKKSDEDDDDLQQLLVPDLVKVLSKCAKEEKTDKDGPPLYIDDSCDMIKCKWCPNFKGSIEACVVNQHCKSSKNYITRRQLLGEYPLRVLHLTTITICRNVQQYKFTCIQTAKHDPVMIFITIISTPCAARARACARAMQTQAR